MANFGARLAYPLPHEAATRLESGSGIATDPLGTMPAIERAMGAIERAGERLVHAMRGGSHQQASTR